MKRYYLALPFSFFLLFINFVNAKTITEKFYTNEYGDGQIEERTQSWLETHDSLKAFSVLNSRGTMHCGTGRHDSNGDYYIRRLFIPFNTKDIPLNAVINSVNLNLTVSGKRHDVLDSLGYITVVHTNQASNTNLSLNDYSKCGEILNPTEGIEINERKSIFNYEAEDKIVFNLNDIGKKWINQENWTKIGLREGHDVENIEPGYIWGDDNWLGFYTSEYPDIEKRPYLEVTYTVPDNPADIDPVIIVPGIMGSWNKNNEWQIDPILHTYDGLIKAFLKIEKDGEKIYENNKTFFTFPYNWRQDNQKTAGELKEVIDRAKILSGRQKVDLVAHSMGGLVSRAYIQGEYYSDDVDDMIFINTPHLGSAEAYLQYAGAYMPGLSGGVMKHVFQKEAENKGYEDLTEYIQEKIISVKQLLPVYNYLYDKKRGKHFLREYPENYPVNDFLDELNRKNKVDSLKEKVKITGVYSYVNPKRTLSGIRVMADDIPGDVKWIYGYPRYLEKNVKKWQVLGEGDGTVPQNSLEFLHQGINEVKYYGQDHREIATKAQTHIIKELTGEYPAEYYKNPWASVKKMLMIYAKCPVDLQVTSPSGKVIGQSFEDSQEINEIPGSFYSGAGQEGEFITILSPETGEYLIKAKGTAEGNYTIGAQILSSGLAEGDRIEFNGSAAPGQIISYDIILNNNKKQFSFTNKYLLKMFDDLQELNERGEIKIEFIYKMMLHRARKVRRDVKRYENKLTGDKAEKKKQEIIEDMERCKVYLGLYLREKFITENAYNVLMKDIEDILKNL